jgi:uncharacterized protein (TIGR02147 family)
MKQLIDFDDYRAYLKYRLTFDKASRGQVARLADHLGCQSSFLSQVLGERSHLSFEHAQSVSDFLELREAEMDYFMNLVHENRSGTQGLKRYYRAKMADAKESLRTIVSQVKVNGQIDPNDQSTYYSQWWFSAVHILSALPGYGSRKAIAEKLNLPHALVNEILHFLTHIKLVKESSEGLLSIGTGRIHLGRDSALISRHHSNWRLKAIDLLSRPEKNDLNYSAVIGISAVDADRIRDGILALLKNSEEILVQSKEEHPFVFNIDFNRLR